MRWCKTRADTALLLFPPWLVSLVDPIWRVSVIAGQLQSQSPDMLSDTSFASSVYAVTPNMVARAPTSKSAAGFVVAVLHESPHEPGQFPRHRHHRDLVVLPVTQPLVHLVKPVLRRSTTGCSLSEQSRDLSKLPDNILQHFVIIGAYLWPDRDDEVLAISETSRWRLPHQRVKRPLNVFKRDAVPRPRTKPQPEWRVRESAGSPPMEMKPEPRTGAANANESPDLLGANNMSGFVARNLSGSEQSPRRLDEPGGDAARDTDGEVRRDL